MNIPTMLALHCPFCEAKNQHGKTCETCALKHYLDGVVACIPYAHPLIQSLIHAWKYNSTEEVTKPIANFVGISISKAQARVLSKSLSSIPPILTNSKIIFDPIPLHPKKLKERGFNQAHLLASYLTSQNSNWRIMQFLERSRATTAQATLDHEDRFHNLANAFKLIENKKSLIQGQDILIVDDVITTGSTIDVAAKLFKQTGAKSVWALTIAYGNPTK
jgi:ComF family protein